MGKIWIGIFGWCYMLWCGSFYFEGLCQDDELYYVLWVLLSIEFNGFFYVLQCLESYQCWYLDMLFGFIFSYKGNCFIMYMCWLQDIDGVLVNVFVFGVLNLKEKFGFFLW